MNLDGARAWWDNLPPMSHPLWKTFNTVVLVGCAAFLVTHMAREGFDAHGAVGAVSGSAVTMLARGIFGGKEN